MVISKNLNTITITTSNFRVLVHEEGVEILDKDGVSLHKWRAPKPPSGSPSEEKEKSS
jgi:hypothetical protein